MNRSHRQHVTRLPGKGGRYPMLTISYTVYIYTRPSSDMRNVSNDS